MLICIIVTRACPDLCTFTSHIHSTTCNQPHWTSNQPRGQRVSFPSSLLWAFLPLPISLSLALSSFLFTSLCRAHCILILSIFGSFSFKYQGLGPHFIRKASRREMRGLLCRWQIGLERPNRMWVPRWQVDYHRSEFGSTLSSCWTLNSWRAKIMFYFPQGL